MKTIMLFVLSLALAKVATAQDCLIDGNLPDFEEVMGYKLAVARDGTEFTAQEKVVFNQLAAVLPEFYQNMQSLDSFERVPDGYTLAGGAVGEYLSRGWRIGNMSRTRGYIALAQDKIKTENGRFVGEFYYNIIHEMTHALDQLEDTFSQTEPWAGLSTWTGEDGMGSSKNFVTWYAPASPEEDFAESMTYFMLEPDTLLAKSPTKFEAISKRYFNGQKYDSKTLLASYEAQLKGLQPAARAEKIKQLRRTDYYACKLLK